MRQHIASILILSGGLTYCAAILTGDVRWVFAAIPPVLLATALVVWDNWSE